MMKAMKKHIKTDFFIRTLLLLLFSSFFVPLQAVTLVVKGQVKDAGTDEAIPFASVEAVGLKRGSQANGKGSFRLTVSQEPDSLRFSTLGYETQTVSFTDFRNNGNKVFLAPSGLQLSEIIVRPKKEKYSKKNNPAVDFVNRLRNAGHATDPKKNDSYNYNKYERITIALNNISPESDKNLILKKFDFLREHIDTSEVSGRPILTISTREKSSEVHYRKDPQSEKEIVTGLRQEGLDDFMDQSNMQILYEDFFKNIDLYSNDIDLLHNRLVSPLSKIGPDFYKYYLLDTVEIDSVRCIQLAFVPRNSESFGFTGRVFVPVGDTTMFIKKVIMNVPKDINLNFIEGIHINQEYEKAPDGSRLPVRDDLVAEVAIIPGTQGVYFRRSTAYKDHNFAPYSDQNLFGKLGSTLYNDNTYTRDSVFWNDTRMIPLTRGEGQIASLTSGLRSKPLYRVGEWFLKTMVQGYIQTGTPSKFDIGPVNTTVSHNTLEGFRFRLGGMTTANLNKRLFARGYAAYGTRDHKFKYSGELEYSFVDKRYHAREFPIHSLRLTHTYDVNMLGQHYAFTNADNMFLSFKRHDDLQIDYLRTTSLKYTLELANNFSVEASIDHQRQEATEYMTFVLPSGTAYNHYNETSFNIRLRYAPGEKVYQMKSDRIRINEEAPAFMLTHVYAPKGFLGNMFEINKTEFSVIKRFWFSAFGYLDGIIKGGHLWSRSPYPDLLIPNANLSYTIQPESFALMNPMEFMTDSYASWDLTYWANGAIFNYIPYLKKLKLREVFSFRGFWGHLSKDNDPQFNKELFMFPSISNTRKMTAKPYMEVGVGIDNIFRILRLDYVWRLTYRDGPGVDKGGLRLALHFTF